MPREDQATEVGSVDVLQESFNGLGSAFGFEFHIAIREVADKTA